MLPPNSLAHFPLATPGFLWRPEHGKASLKTLGDADLGTRKSHADALVGWHTDVVDDDPQLIPIGRRGRMRQIRDSGEDQPHGSREN